MTPNDRITNLERLVAELSRAQAGKPVRLASGGESGDFFQVIRGQAYGANLDTDQAFQIHNIVALEDHSEVPDSPLWIANIPLQAHADGDTIYALYRAGIAVTAIGAPETVDWEAFSGSNSSTPPLREFELTVAKARGDTTATVKWLTEFGSMTGSALDIDDATVGSRFAGKAADYLEGEVGFQGQAILMRDLATESPGPDTWRMINMEGFAEFIVCTWYSTGVGHYVSNESVDDPWSRREPATVGDAITITDPGSLLPASPDTSLKLVCRLRDPDTSPPTYKIVGLKGSSGGGGIRFARVTSAIGGATSATSWGGGVVKLQDKATGTVSGSTTNVDNPLIGVSFVVDCQVQLDMSTTPPQVMNGLCDVASGW